MARVLDPGLSSTVQDAGRRGYRRYGVPSSGALDLESFFAANRVAGNTPERPAVEVVGGDFAMELLYDVTLAVTGDGSRPALGGVVKETYSPIRARRGEVLRLASGGAGFVSYVAVGGGFRGDRVLGSASTYLPGRFGGVGGRRLARGDALYLDGPLTRGGRPEEPRPPCDDFPAVVGPHARLFAGEALRAFFSSEYAVSPLSDRMGCRLEGARLKMQGQGEIVSLAVFPGMVQVPPDGRPVVLLADCQTTGGYPVVAYVVQPYLSRLSQTAPGGTIRFRRTDGRRALAALERFLEETR